MRLSIVIPVLNSHEVVRRQLLHWNQLVWPVECEIIVMDDGSDPPLVDFCRDRISQYLRAMGGLQIVPTNDLRPWTWALARNAGARIATGEYLLMTDIDYIITQECIDAAMAFTGDKLRFKREFGVLDEHGNIRQDSNVLLRYGLDPERLRTKGIRMPPHPNNFCIRRALFWEMGGYPEDRIGWPYPQGEDRWFKRQWIKFVNSGKAKESEVDDRPTLLMFPNGQFCGDVDHNPFGLFHALTRKNDFNPAHLKIEARNA